MAKKRKEHSQKYAQAYDEIADRYYELAEIFGDADSMTMNELREMESELRRMIKELPSYLDTYLLLYSVLHFTNRNKEALDIVDEAYKKALTLIVDKKGNWPDLIEWGWLENRPILRSLSLKATLNWINSIPGTNDWDEAIAIYTKMLKSSPDDNTGARFSLLAMLEKMSHADYLKTWLEEKDDDLIYKKGHDAWFEKQSKKHREVDWWLPWAKKNF